MMNWHDGTFTPRGICSFGITEVAIPAALAWGAEALGLFGAGEAAAGAVGIGEAALGAEAGAGLFGAAETGAGALGIGEAAGAGAEALSFAGVAPEAGSNLMSFAGVPDTAFSSGATTGGASIADLAGAGGNTAFGASPEAAGSLTNPATYGNIAGGGTGGDASIFGKLISGISNNPLQAAGVGIAGAGLGYNMLQGSKDSAERKALGSNAKMLGTQGKELMSYLQSGTLPPGLQMLMDKETAASRARVIQNAAQNGMPTDPSQNSALAQELNNIDQQAMIKTAQLGQQLLTQGISEVGMADDLYAKLIGIDKAQAQSTGLAISNFAAALGGRPQMQQQRAA